MVKSGLSRRARNATPTHERKRLRERGASMVEFAIIAPLFFLVLFGGIEIGLMFRSYLALEDVTRSAGRVASIERDDPEADTAILQSLDRSTRLLQGDVKSIVIFNAASLDGEVPEECTTGFVDDVCSFYNAEDTTIADLVAAGPNTDGWPATDRDADDNIGIHIEFEYRYATGFFDTLTLTSSTVQVIEGDLN